MSYKVPGLQSSAFPVIHCPQCGAAFVPPCNMFLEDCLIRYLDDTAGDSGQRVPVMSPDCDSLLSEEEPAVGHGGEKELLQFAHFCCKLQKGCSNNKSIHKGVLLNNSLRTESGYYRENIEWTKGCQLGAGKFGSVFEVHDNMSNFKCAAKKVQLENFKKEELEIWKGLSGPHVVELFGAILEGDLVIYFMQIAEGGSLSGLIKCGCLSENLALYYFKNILDALDYLHKQCIIHNDVKADNILLSDNTQELFLSDFSFVEKFGPGQDLFRKKRLQGRTQTHMAPEVARQSEHDSRADVWSCTCTLLHMLNARPPWIKKYRELPSLDVVIANNSPPLFEIPERCHKEVRRLIEMGLTVDQHKRPQAGALRDEVHAVLTNMYPSRSCFDNNIKKLKDNSPLSSPDPSSMSINEQSPSLSSTLLTLMDKPTEPVFDSTWDLEAHGSSGNAVRKESDNEIIIAFHRARLSTCNSTEDFEDWLEMVQNADNWLDDEVMDKANPT